ncbi:hypothetical protein ACFFGH_27725 [Lysobacter korlensis]|uniref:MatE family transporter n=1 Tax=Lysobacter korlensis TaxID=553636 RepID=A0ABV6RXD8_9GAMM
MSGSNVPAGADEAASFDDALTEDALTDDDARTDDRSPTSGDAEFAGVDITEREGPDLAREDRTDR